MNAERWKRMQAIFHDVVDLPQSERERWLREHCPADDLRRDVERLLAANDSGRDLVVTKQAPAASLEIIHKGLRLGNVVLEEEIGEGGSGVVWRAKQTSPARTVAVKILHGRFASKRDVEDFRGECDRISRLNHPGIVKILFADPEGVVPYLVMEHVASSLQKLLRECDERESGAQPRHAWARAGALDPARAAAIARDVADALEHAHERGIVHRDVKPANILIDDDGRSRLIDFGIAREIHRAHHTGRLFGSGPYMSPEQTRPGEPDRRTDVYSLGVVLYEMLTLKNPFAGADDVEAAVRGATAPPVRKLNPAVHRDLELICQKAMSKDPRERFPTCAKLMEALQCFLEHKPSPVKPPTLADRLRRSTRRHPIAWGACVAALVLVPAAWAVDRTRAARARLDDALDGIEALTARAPDLDAQIQRNQEATSRLALLPASFPSSELTARRRQVESELQSRTQETHEELRAEFARFMRSCEADPTGFDYERAFLLAGRLHEGGLGDEETKALLNPFLPAVELRTVPPGAEVVAQRIDYRSGLPIDGQPEHHLGRSDLTAQLSPGLWHFRATLEDGRSGELVWSLYQGCVSTATPTIYLRTAAEVALGMVKIAAGPMSVPYEERATAAAGQETLDLPAFWIDRFEVTNGDYKKFLRATNHPPPKRWVSDFAQSDSPEWDKKPVVWVNFLDVCHYAAWAGKRPVWASEWLRVARGAAGDPLPAGLAGVDLAELHRLSNVLAHDGVIDSQLAHARQAEKDHAQARRAYLEHVLDVGNMPSDRSAEGVYDLLGNVQEWTLSVTPQLGLDGTPTPSLGDRLIRGLSWRRKATTLTAGRFLLPNSAVNDDVGFRCARSASEKD